MTKRLPIPATVRFQTSQRGVKFASVKDAKKDFLSWLETGKSPAGAKTEVHIWQNEKDRVISAIDQSARGEILRQTIRGALQSGRLQIRARGKSR